ncbi:hypothetical protein KW471_00600 [Vibrio fluvialis]|nr:hypothetical protein [Vibrio fluvialis]MBY8063290.1 hypothetical protein [Vibrio fluvialis]
MDVFFTPRLKLERALKHVDELNKISSPLSKELYEIKALKKFDPQRPLAIDWSLIYRPLKPLSETFGLIIGDAISNFRSALDHLASGLAREIDPSQSPYFPMSTSRNGLENHKYLPKLESTLPGSSELLLQQIRPVQSPDEIYWSFHKLDNDNKHNIILPTVSAVTIDNINVRFGGNTISNVGFSGDATKQINMIRTGGAPMQINNLFSVIIDLTFPSDSLFPNMNVVETLINIGKVVEKTIDAFESLYREKDQN